MKILSKPFSHSSAGFALLYSILVSAVLFFIMAGIYSVSLREAVISSSARDSQIAFYAADNAMECALYGEIVDDLFVSSSATIDCNGDTFTVDQLNSDPEGYEYEVIIFSDEGCAIVNVDTNYLTSGLPGKRIRSKGFNSCSRLPPGPGPLVDNPFLVERVLRATYRVWDE